MASSTHWHSFCLSALALACLSSLAHAQAPAFVVEGDRLELHAGDAVILQYQITQNPHKPYVREFRTPDGRQILRDGAASHPHHHGLMFAIGINDTNFWEQRDRDDPGLQIPQGGIRAALSHRNGHSVAHLTQKLHWQQKHQDQALLAIERRRIDIHTQPIDDARLLTWHTNLEPAPGLNQIELWGGASAEGAYYGLGIRFVQELDGPGAFREAASDGDRHWCAYTVELEDQPVTVALFSHPQNIRQPDPWFTMHGRFAYMSAVLGLHAEAMTLEADESLAVTYALAAWDADVSEDRINRLYDRWLSNVELDSTELPEIQSLPPDAPSGQ